MGSLRCTRTLCQTVPVLLMSGAPLRIFIAGNARDIAAVSAYGKALVVAMTTISTVATIAGIHGGSKVTMANKPPHGDTR